MSVGRAAISGWEMPRIRTPTATPYCSRPMPIRSMPAFTTGYLMTPQGLCRRLRASDLAQHVRGQVRVGGEVDEGIRRARQGQSGQVQLRDAADRHDAADSARGSQIARKAAQA